LGGIFTLTLGGVYWEALFLSGTLVTVIKEALDLWNKGHWLWGFSDGELAGAFPYSDCYILSACFAEIKSKQY
jgi:hypothetical protein